MIRSVLGYPYRLKRRRRRWEVLIESPPGGRFDASIGAIGRCRVDQSRWHTFDHAGRPIVHPGQGHPRSRPAALLQLQADLRAGLVARA